jgi:hypothetical protein
VFKTRVNADPVLRELDALYERTGEGGVLLRQPQRSVTMPGGRRIELTNDERSELQRLTGTLQASMARELIASPAWARLPDEARVKVMANRLSAAGNVGKHILFREQIRNPSGDDLLALRHARARGLR